MYSSKAQKDVVLSGLQKHDFWWKIEEMPDLFSIIVLTTLSNFMVFFMFRLETFMI